MPHFPSDDRKTLIFSVHRETQTWCRNFVRTNKYKIRKDKILLTTNKTGNVRIT